MVISGFLVTMSSTVVFGLVLTSVVVVLVSINFWLFKFHK
jgi:hypothetical protein